MTRSLPPGFDGFDADDLGFETTPSQLSPEDRAREESARLLGSLRRDDVIQIGKHRWVVFNANGVSIYVYKYGTKAKKFYKVDLHSTNPIAFEVVEMLGGGARRGEVVAIGPLIPF